MTWIDRHRLGGIVEELEREVDHMLGMGIEGAGIESAIQTATGRLREAITEDTLRHRLVWYRTHSETDRIRAQLWPCPEHDVVDCPRCAPTG